MDEMVLKVNENNSNFDTWMHFYLRCLQAIILHEDNNIICIQVCTGECG